MPHHRNGKEIDLETTCEDLFSLFEQGLPQDQQKTIAEYFEQREKEEVMAESVVDKNRYAAIRNIFEQDLLPAYNAFWEKKEEILEKSRKRVWWKYVGATVAAVEVIEAIATKGKSLQWRALLGTGLAASGLGYGIYWVLDKYDQHKIHNERKRLELLVKTKAEKLTIDVEYGEHQEVMRDFQKDGSDYRKILAREMQVKSTTKE